MSELPRQSDSIPEAETSPSSPEAKPPADTGGRLRAVALFAAVTLAVVAADLTLKRLAFQRVAFQPVRIHRPETSPGSNAESPDTLVIPSDKPRRIIQPRWGRRIIPRVLHLKLTTNTGAVFGLGSGGQGVFIAVSIIAAIVIVVLFWRSAPSAWPYHLALALILGGALGNLYDRLMYAAVRDMLWLLPGTGLWPWIFNLADASLVVGVGVVVAWTGWREMKSG